MFIIVMGSPGGELDRREAHTPRLACQALIEMLEELEEVNDGDTFTITDTEEQ